ncbi:hypothetical protein FRC07_006976 [Ceratobasidium sp. 392]|nr:hypothetical protein FRC07_006976 [Ceratobasidium sp. 392]
MSSPRSSDYSLSRSSSSIAGATSVTTDSVDFIEDNSCAFDASRVMYRPMTSADVPRVKEMHHDFLKTSATIAHIRQQLSHSHRRVFVAFIPNKSSAIIGFSAAQITYHGTTLPPEISINAVGVDPLYRSHGVGENLIRAVSGSLLMSSTSQGKGPADGSALVQVELKARSKAIPYFEHLGWQRELGEVRKGISWGRVSVQEATVRLSRWINAHEL